MKSQVSPGVVAAIVVVLLILCGVAYMKLAGPPGGSGQVSPDDQKKAQQDYSQKMQQYRQNNGRPMAPAAK